MATKDLPEAGHAKDGEQLPPLPDSSKKPEPLSADYKDRATYPMTERRGTAVIVSIIHFKEKSLPPRKGSINDAKKLKKCFEDLAFDVVEITSSENEEKIKKETVEQKLHEISQSEKEKGRADCFVCCILTYGHKGMLFFGDHDFENPTPLSVDDLVSIFKPQKCNVLAGTPKLFFIQACDPEYVTVKAGGFGDKDKGVPVEEIKIPSEADILIHMCNIPGSYNWVKDLDTLGSHFIGALTQVINENCVTKIENGESAMDVMRMLTRVNQAVLSKYEKEEKKKRLPDDIIVPSVISTLTKKVVFKKKEVEEKNESLESNSHL